MKRIFFILAALALPSLASAQTSNVRIVGRDSAGNDRPVLVSDDGKLQVSSGQAPSTGQAVTVANGADVAEGTTADSAYTGTGSCTTISCLKGIYTGMVAPTPAGTNSIGRVSLLTDTSSSSGSTNTASTSVTAGQVFKSASGNLYGINVVSGATAGYVMVFNATSIPADGTVTPARCYVLAANSSFDLAFKPTPIFFGTGIVVVFSTTGCFTKTASATAFIAADYK